MLNLGHTFGHSFERIANFKHFTHGEAVSVGTILAFKISNDLNYCSLEDYNRVNNHFISLYALRALSLDSLISIIGKG